MALRHYQEAGIAETAARIKGAGFRVFIAERPTYGFYTDEDGTYVVCFQADLGGISFSGNYRSTRSGGGWRLITSTPEEMFKQRPPMWAVGGEPHPVTMKTLAMHLKDYQKSSRYKEVIDFKFTFTGTARKKGAIGVVYDFTDSRVAKTLGEAEVALYDKWEHVTVRDFTVEYETMKEPVDVHTQ